MGNEYHKIPVFFKEALKCRQGIDSTAYRLFNGIGDGLDGITLDKFNKHYVLQIFDEKLEKRAEYIGMKFLSCIDAEYFIVKLRCSSNGLLLEETPTMILKDTRNNSQTVVVENGLNFLVDCNDAVNNGLFLDMRDNRQKLTAVLSEENSMLNCFSYTCSFGVYAASRGSKTVNVDISRKTLDWGKKNYELNNLALDGGEFVQSDVLEYLDMALMDKLKFNSIVLDPPSFSRNKKEHFSAKDSFNELICKSLMLLEKNGTILVSSNNSLLSHAFFLSTLSDAANCVGRNLLAFNKVGQGKDFVGSGETRESSLHGLLAWVD